MYDLESINADQLVTATDRLLLGHRLKRRSIARLHDGARGTADLTVAARRAVVQSERTVFMRQVPAPKKYLRVLGAAAAAAWLCVAVLCLLV